MSIALGNAEYGVTVLWGTATACWLLHLDDADGVRILSSIPLVCGSDLLEPFTYLNIGGGLYAATDGDTFTPPTYDNLGTLGRLYFEAT
jgi:hypothetical protein